MTTGYWLVGQSLRRCIGCIDSLKITEKFVHTNIYYGDDMRLTEVVSPVTRLLPVPLAPTACPDSRQGQKTPSLLARVSRVPLDER